MINMYTHSPLLSLSLSLSHSHSHFHPPLSLSLHPSLLVELAQEMEHQEGEIAGSSNEEEDDYKPSRPGPGSENNKSSVIGKSNLLLGKRRVRSTYILNV